LTSTPTDSTFSGVSLLSSIESEVACF
jgi:hypothetical protein